LSPARLPFHHSGTRALIDNEQSIAIQEIVAVPSQADGPFESGALGLSPLIAFAVAKALWRDLASPFFPRGMLQRGVEHLLGFGDELGFFFFA
jgi:hypothetical protein